MPRLDDRRRAPVDFALDLIADHQNVHALLLTSMFPYYMVHVNWITFVKEPRTCSLEHSTSQERCGARLHSAGGVGRGNVGRDCNIEI